MEPYEQGSAVLPRPLRQAALDLPPAEQRMAEELRLRVGQPMTVVLPEGERPLTGRRVERQDLEQLVELASRASLHAVMDRLAQGYLTLPGGHRLGLCGRAVSREGHIRMLREYSSANLRLARQRRGVARPLLGRLWRGEGPANTLIISPPGLGKTTLLRDLIRAISAGDGCPSRRVGVADERGELSALWEGRAQLDLGPRTDVVEGCPKGEGLMLLLRAMNPQVLAADEITAVCDVDALEQAAGCGVSLVMTAHGRDRADLERRPVYRRLLASGIPERLVIIGRRDGERTYEVEELK